MSKLTTIAFGFRLGSLIVLMAGSLLTAACARGSGGGAVGSLPGVTSQPIADLASLDFAPGQKLQVVATTSLVAEPAWIVGGGMVDVTVLIQRGGDPHQYQPTPQDAVALADADAILAVGFGYETFLGNLISGAGADVPVVMLSEGVEPQPVYGGSAPSSGEIDPHVWLDPQNMITWTRNVAAAYSALDPAHAPDYQANADKYVDVLQRLDTWASKRMGALTGDHLNVASDHAVLGYMARRYGLNIVGTIRPAASDLSDPSAKDLADLEDKLRAQHVGAIFVGTYDNHPLADRVSQDTGIPVVPLYLESLSPRGGPASTYDDMMRYNVRAIVEALK